MSPTRGWSSATANPPARFRWPLPFSVRADEAQLIGMLAALPLGIALLDSRGCLMACNDAFRLTVDCACTVGKPLPPEMTIPADRAVLARALSHALRGGVALPFEMRLRLPARPAEPMVMTIAKAPPGVNSGLLIAVRDIREQLRLERQVAQVTRMQAIGQLAGGVAHDFNNILTANHGLAEQLRARHAPGDPDYEDLSEMLANDARGADLVRQLLAFARQQTLRIQLVDVRAVVEAVAALLRRLLETDVALNLDFGDVGPIRVDPGQLEQVIVNLAVNARDAMPGGGTLDIVTRGIAAADVAALGHRIMPRGDYVEIAVCDTGTGIPKELGAKIFEPFFSTKAVGSGTGLGLSTVYGIVKQSGGFVFNAPRPEGGTIFTLYFPRAVPGVGERIGSPPPEVHAVVTSGDVGAAHILLVEDDRAVRMVLRRALLAGGFAVTEAVDALAALPLVDDRAFGFDVLVSDVMMPGMDGTALAAYARDRRPGLPVVLMSGYAEAPLRDAAGDERTMFLAKPFAVSALTAAIRTALVPGG